MENYADFPILIAKTGPLSGERWLIKKEIRIGRDPFCDIVVPERQVSRFHSRIYPEKNNILLEDLGSKNGTFLNGNTIEEPVVLQEGDIIQIALIQSFYFLSSDATMPLDGSEFIPVDLTEEKKVGIVLDEKSRRVWIGREEIDPPLSFPQFRLLEQLHQQAGKVVSRSDLISAIWGDEGAIGISDQALDALVRRLRERIALIDPDHEYLVTVRGHGIRLDNLAE
jgi:hypothetical protein